MMTNQFSLTFSAFFHPIKVPITFAENVNDVHHSLQSNIQ